MSTNIVSEIATILGNGKGLGPLANLPASLVDAVLSPAAAGLVRDLQAAADTAARKREEEERALLAAPHQVCVWCAGFEPDTGRVVGMVQEIVRKHGLTRTEVRVTCHDETSLDLAMIRWTWDSPVPEVVETAMAAAMREVWCEEKPYVERVMAWMALPLIAPEWPTQCPHCGAEVPSLQMRHKYVWLRGLVDLLPRCEYCALRVVDFGGTVIDPISGCAETEEEGSV